MEWLNYQHLYYFWTVAREGSIAKACPKLRLAPPTISGQIHALEDSLGEKLFARKGRGLVLTEMGTVVFRFANEIFTLGEELLDTVKDRPTGRPMKLAIGVTDVVPKLIVRRLIGPLRQRDDPLHLVCIEDKLDRLLVELAAHALDVVIADVPVPASSAVRAFSHPLGECGVSFFATRELARRFRPRFPVSLQGAPLLVPTASSGLRRSLDDWFRSVGAKPEFAIEADDHALLESLGRDGLGIFPTFEVLEGEVRDRYDVELVGRVERVRASFYAITVERRLDHPGIAALLEQARGGLFAGSGPHPPRKAEGA